MSYETYYIPANYTDAGRILGLFEIRNVVEAVALSVPVLYLCLLLLPLALTAKIIVTLIILVPVAGFALIGISDDSLIRYIKTRLHWHKKKRILTYRGEIDNHGFERAYLRRKRQGH